MSDNDIYDLDNKIRQPSYVGTCFNPKCKVCSHFQQKITMTIIEGPCWKCYETMKIAYISGSKEIVRGSGHLAPRGFTSEEINFAKSKGVHLKTQYSKTIRDNYAANSCAKCGSFAGDFYLPNTLRQQSMESYLLKNSTSAIIVTNVSEKLLKTMKYFMKISITKQLVGRLNEAHPTYVYRIAIDGCAPLSILQITNLNNGNNA